jgi:hypothetical protein
MKPQSKVLFFEVARHVRKGRGKVSYLLISQIRQHSYTLCGGGDLLQVQCQLESLVYTPQSE